MCPDPQDLALKLVTDRQGHRGDIDQPAITSITMNKSRTFNPQLERQVTLQIKDTLLQVCYYQENHSHGGRWALEYYWRIVALIFQIPIVNVIHGEVLSSLTTAYRFSPAGTPMTMGSKQTPETYRLL
jgi:hypothetical protein